MKPFPNSAFLWHLFSLRWLVCITIGSSLLFTCNPAPPLPLLPKASFQLTNNPCAAPCDPGFVNLSQYPQSYRWNFGDGTTSTEETPRHTYTQGGSYGINLQVTGEDNLTHDTTITATILDPAPIAAFTILNNNCTAPCEVSFQNQSQNAQSYRWEFGTGGTAVEANPKHTYTRGGTYEVKLTATGARNLTNTKTQTVTIQQPVPVAAFAIENDNCLTPCTVVLRNQSQNATSYSWKILRYTSSATPSYRLTTEQSPSETYVEAAPFNGANRLPFTAELTVTGPGGSKTITKNIAIRPGPEANFTHTFSFPGNGKILVTLTNTSKYATSYMWYYGDGQTSTAVNPPPYEYKSGHSVTLNAFNETKTSRQQKVVLYTPPPIR